MLCAASPILRAVCLVLTIYWIILFIRILSSWFPPPIDGPMRTLFDLLHDVTDPALKPLQGLIPPVRMGAMAMDFSPILLFVILAVARTAIGC